ncbi:hypothetical protein [Aquabacterium sp.]|uniref:hypothetical protein n=1 Tax=Aquabacterium sp. TaxID=1872578 RepID=UPI002C5E59D6|nr:hypothetical protein [Aquabacterium sp.]HSW05081.1 hypothetical protein [Aquabacterium sp.]
MSETDLAGWGAAGLTLLTFVCKDMRQLRLLAICANGAFISYGAMAGLVPVLVLHVALAPINVWRLLQHRSGVATRRSTPAAAAVLQPASAPESKGVASRQRKASVRWRVAGTLRSNLSASSQLQFSRRHQNFRRQPVQGHSDL